jgi:hypothetical protein
VTDLLKSLGCCASRSVSFLPAFPLLVSGKIPVGLCPAGEYRVVVHHDAMSVTRNRYDSTRTRRRYSKAEVAEVRVRVR